MYIRIATCLLICFSLATSAFAQIAPGSVDLGGNTEHGPVTGGVTSISCSVVHRQGGNIDISGTMASWARVPTFYGRTIVRTVTLEKRIVLPGVETDWEVVPDNTKTFTTNNVGPHKKPGESKKFTDPYSFMFTNGVLDADYEYRVAARIYVKDGEDLIQLGRTKHSSSTNLDP